MTDDKCKCIRCGKLGSIVEGNTKSFRYMARLKRTKVYCCPQCINVWQKSKERGEFFLDSREYQVNQYGENPIWDEYFLKFLKERLKSKEHVIYT